MEFLLIIGLRLFGVYGQTFAMSNRLGGSLKILARDAATVLGAVMAVSFFSTQAFAGPDIGKPLSVITETISPQKVGKSVSASKGAGIDAALEAAAAQIAGAVAPITKPVAAAFQPQFSSMKITASSSTRDREINCLAEAVYYEARGEPERGQLAVAEVVANRVESRAYPNTYCGVVNQKYRNICQFSWACNSRLSTPRGAQWAKANDIAEKVYDGWKPNVVGNATHFHAARVNPRWSRILPKIDQIGSHIFYGSR